MTEASGLLPLVKKLLGGSDWDESDFDVLEANRLEDEQLTGHPETSPKKSRPLTTEVKSRLNEALPLFIRADDGAVAFIHFKVQQYLDSTDRSSAEEVRIGEWSQIIRDATESYRLLAASQTALRRRIAVFASGFQIDGKLLDTMNSALFAFNQGLESMQYAEQLLAELSELVPPEPDVGSNPLSKDLRGGNPVTKLGEMIAVVFAASGRNVEDPKVGFRDMFRRFYFVLDDAAFQKGTIPSETHVFAEINKRIRRRIEQSSKR